MLRTEYEKFAILKLFPSLFILQIGDPTGEATAQMNLADLKRTLGVDTDGSGDVLGSLGGPSSGRGFSEVDDDGLYGADGKARQRRLSMERMDLLKVCLCFRSGFLRAARLLFFLA